MKSDYEQIIIYLAEHELRHSRYPEIKKLEAKIGDLEAEIKSLCKEIKILIDQRKNLSEQLEKEYICKMREFTETVERIGQELQTTKGLARYLPKIKPGRTSRFESSDYPEIGKKKMRAIMLVEELKRRKTNNPDRPVTSRTSPRNTHANDLAVELSDVDVTRLGYQTIRKAWDKRDKN